MILDTSGIDREQLIRFVEDVFALEIIAIAFQPLGEASYSYVAEEQGGTRWVVKLQEKKRAIELEERLRAVTFVHTACGFMQVVAPRHNRWGDCACPYEQYMVTVFPFIEGDPIEPGRQTDEYLGEVASLLAAFHKHGSSLPFPIPRETFDHPFEEPILRALRTVEAPGQLANPTQEQLRKLMLAQRWNLFTTLENMRQIQGAVRKLDLDWVLTHGDPNWANMLVDRSNVFHLLDWDDLALGPPERDLVFLSDRETKRFEAVLRQYLTIHGSVKLHAEVFAFYHYRWVVQEIADYTTRILFRNVDPAEDQHAWAELQPYLPADHAGIETGVRQIEEVLARIIGK